MALALIPITLREAFGIMTRCRELNGRVRVCANASNDVRLWGCVLPTGEGIILCGISNRFYVQTSLTMEGGYVA